MELYHGSQSYKGVLFWLPHRQSSLHQKKFAKKYYGKNNSCMNSDKNNKSVSCIVIVRAKFT